MTPQVTSGSLTISVLGDDANIILTLDGKGTGGVRLRAGGTAFFHGNTTGIGFFNTTPLAAKTGWGVLTRTLARTTYATYTAPDISAAYTEAEVQALADHVQVLSRTVAALVTDLHQTAGYGLLRT